ncbi:sugar-binding protein [Brachybacterium fresconis]|uniref:LmbE family N-acetylglucosaminyl deacetylase n=1 Tax=Brachybacterium fresconis TaxID=173363 RepID=A0ABS4YMK5_9MICO|nr:sugar-binding protein [Brachybacterium fresconis]MBP2409745.1 LmbE family N-acetylglucosaminyl deacetylase [Brachybacterium fresconis]
MSHPAPVHDSSRSDASRIDPAAPTDPRSGDVRRGPFSRRRLLQGTAALGLAAGATALDLTSLTPEERALADGTVDLDILYIGAHPDDEAWTLAALGQWNEFAGQRAGVITVTRGEGGGNAVGLEEGPALGLIRETEERTAVGYAGIEHVFNLDAVDFFYTLSAPLTYDVWGGAEVLSRIIRVVRATRPDVIVTMNPSAVEGNHGNHQQAAMFAVEAYLLAGREDVFPEHFDEGLRPFSPRRILRSGSNGTSSTGPDAVAEGYEPEVASDVVFGAWNGTPSERHGKRWSAVRDDAVHSYRTQGWFANPPSPTDPAQIPATWFTLLASRTPLADPTSSDTAALAGASLPIDGGLPLGTTVEIDAGRFAVLPGQDLEVTVTVGSPGRALPGAAVELEVPQGWSVGGAQEIGTVPAKQQRAATFTVTVAEDAAPGEHVLLRARATSRGASGQNVLPLRTAGPVEAGLAERPEIAEFLAWTEELGMQRLDTLVPTRRAIGSGRAETLEVVARNLSEAEQDAEVVLDLPEGFAVDPAQLLVEAIPAGGESTVEVRIENTDASLPTANRAPDGGVYPVTVTATAAGVTAPRSQGLHLVPRLVATRTEGVEIDAARGTGEYPGDSIDIGTLWEGEEVTPEDASGTTWVTYDDENLYVFVKVVDDTLGALLPPEDNKQRFRTDSIEIMVDPRATSENTASTFILGALPGTAVDGGIGGPVAGRDHDNRQGPIDETAPGVRIDAIVSDPYEGYVFETRIPFAELPDGIVPEHLGFNVVVYDSDTQDKTGQSRIGWSTFPGVQADPYRWGLLELPGLTESPSDPAEPQIPDTAARSVQSPASIIQAAEDGTGLGGAPALSAQALRLDKVSRTADGVSARVRTREAGTVRLYLWGGGEIVGALDAQEVGAGKETLEVLLTGDVSEDDGLRLAASLETEGGTAAADAAV